MWQITIFSVKWLYSLSLKMSFFHIVTKVAFPVVCMLSTSLSGFSHDHECHVFSERREKARARGTGQNAVLAPDA